MGRKEVRFAAKLGTRTGIAGVVLAVGLGLSGCPWSTSEVQVPQTIIESNLGTVAAQDGGGTTAVASFDATDGTQWAFYNMANRLAATPVGTSKGAVHEITVPGMVRHVTLVNYDNVEYALLSMGDHGIGVVNVTDPAAMSLVSTVKVNYEQGGISYAEGGGDIVSDVTISGTDGPVTDMVTDGTSLWIADSAYGIHRTALANLLPTPVTEADGTLKVANADGSVNEVYTLQYAGENPWGGPQSLRLYDGKLYAALGALGLGVYDPPTLQRLGGYNLYTDTGMTEDWFQGMDPKTAVHDPSWIDPVTGMPTYQQANYEIKEIWHNGAPGATPWADFDRYGQYYYTARAVDLQTVPQGQGSETIAYVAYSLGGLVAVNITNPAGPQYLGYVPAVPAHGPDEPTGQQSKSLFPHFGSGMLKEAGVVAVKVDTTADKVYYSDHFAGLVVVNDASHPDTWHGPNGAGSYNNDTQPSVPFWPDYEFVTSYNMAPHDPTEEESLPDFLYAQGGPIALATGELSGHGGALMLMPKRNPGAVGQVDVVQADGAGGVNFVDIESLDQATPMQNRFGVPAVFVSTHEVGATVDGAASQDIAIGHTAGVTVSGPFLYVSDGPHGMSVWRIADGEGHATDAIHLVANTLQDEYPEVSTSGETILPTPHAYGVAFDGDPGEAYVLTQSLGLRRVDVGAVRAGQARVGAPALLKTTPSGIFEHSSEGTGNLGGINGQDHAYGVAFTAKYAIVADGSNGLTVYDRHADPTAGNHVVANIGSAKSKPSLGRATAVTLWADSRTGRKYAIVAAGSSGISVVDMTDLLEKGLVPGMTLVKTFQPIKIEEEADEGIHIGNADGRSVDVKVVGDYAYFTYDSFGMVAYRLPDLVAPVPAGVDPTKLFDEHTGVDHRPVAVGRFQLQQVPGYEDNPGGAQYMTAQYFPANTPIRNAAGDVYQLAKSRLLLYVAYSDGGVIKLDWSDPANPKLLQYHDTVGEAASTAIANGRVYVADGDGGLVVLR